MGEIMADEILREIRINPIVPAKSVLISTARGMRPRKPEESLARDTRPHVDSCPFCSGNEHLTPAEILRAPKNGSWAIRIVENLYPVLGEDSSRPRLIFGAQQAIDGYGRHEVIIDHPDHGIALHQMSESHLASLFGVYQQRIRQLYEADQRLRFVLVFKNFGPASGGSIPHTHSQIIAMPMVPQNLHDEVEGSLAYFLKHNQCIFCTLIDEALTFETTIYDRESGKIRRQHSVGQYVVERGKHFIAIKPFASCFEWEVHLLPLHHRDDFLSATPEELDDLAMVLRRTMARLDAVLGSVQYNYFLHSMPRGDERQATRQSFHWHLEICPRTSIPTGFELGSGLFVNSVSPEQAARRLREVKLPE